MTITWKRKNADGEPLPKKSVWTQAKISKLDNRGQDLFISTDKLHRDYSLPASTFIQQHPTKQDRNGQHYPVQPLTEPKKLDNIIGNCLFASDKIFDNIFRRGESSFAASSGYRSFF